MQTSIILLLSSLIVSRTVRGQRNPQYRNQRLRKYASEESNDDDMRVFWSRLLSGMSYPTAKPLTRNIMTTTSPTGHPQKNLTVSLEPTSKPSSAAHKLTIKPLSKPSMNPTSKSNFGVPTTRPTTKSSTEPSAVPSVRSSVKPSTYPSVRSSVNPSTYPSASSSIKPSANPSLKPSSNAKTINTSTPSVKPMPSSKPSTYPSHAHSSVMVTTQPLSSPTGKPTIAYSGTISAKPTMRLIFTNKPAKGPKRTFAPNQKDIGPQSVIPSGRRRSSFPSSSPTFIPQTPIPTDSPITLHTYIPIQPSFAPQSSSPSKGITYAPYCTDKSVKLSKSDKSIKKIATSYENKVTKSKDRAKISKVARILRNYNATELKTEGKSRKSVKSESKYAKCKSKSSKNSKSRKSKSKKYKPLPSSDVGKSKKNKSLRYSHRPQTLGAKSGRVSPVAENLSTARPTIIGNSFKSIHAKSTSNKDSHIFTSTMKSLSPVARPNPNNTKSESPTKSRPLKSLKAPTEYTIVLSSKQLKKQK